VLIVAGGGVVEGGDDGMRGMVTRVGGLLVVIGLMAGCSAGAKEPGGLTASPTVIAASPTATPTPTPTASTGVVLDLSDPALGIVFEAVPDVHGDAADVYNWIATFEKEAWRTITTNQVSPAMDVIASVEVKAQGQATVDGNVRDGSVFGGVIHLRVGGISVDGDTARGTACRDYANVTFSDAGGPDTPEQAGFGQPRLMEMTLARVGAENRWKIITLKGIGTC
jgi:hypothetical protein